MAKWLLTLLMACWPLVAAAQIAGPPHTFVAGTVISPDEVNTNFNTAYQQALNRTGGTMTGLLVTQDVIPDTDGGRSLGNSSNRYNQLWLAGAINCSTGCIGSTELQTDAVITAAITDGAVTTAKLAAGAVTDAKVTSITEGKITDGSILARVASAETISQRWTFTGGAPFTIVLDGGKPGLLWIENDAATDAGRWDLAVDGGLLRWETRNDANALIATLMTLNRGTGTLNVLQGAVTVAGLVSAGGEVRSGTTMRAGNGFVVGGGANIVLAPDIGTGVTGETVLLRPQGANTTTNQALLTSAGVFSAPSFSGNGASLTALNASNVSIGNLAYARLPSGAGTWTATPTISGTLTTGGPLDVSHALRLTGATQATTLTGDVNNYNPTGLSSTNRLGVSCNSAGTNCSITGLQTQTGGHDLVLCNDDAGATGDTVTLTMGDASSLANNQFLGPANLVLPTHGCARMYDAGMGWRVYGNNL